MLRNIFISLIGLMLLCGCSDSPKGFPKVVSCQITVTRGSTPIDEVDVTLEPTTPVSSILFFGKTDSQGVCNVATTFANHSKNGVPEGIYKVILVKEPPVEETKTQEELGKMSRSEIDAYRAQIKKKRDALPRIIPTVLTQSSSTPLKIDVTSSGATLAVNLDEYK